MAVEYGCRFLIVVGKLTFIKITKVGVFHFNTTSIVHTSPRIFLIHYCTTKGGGRGGDEDDCVRSTEVRGFVALKTIVSLGLFSQHNKTLLP